MSTHRHWLAKPICQLKMSLVNQIFSIGTSNTSVTFISMSTTDWKGEPKWSGHRSIQWGKNVCMGHTPNTFHQSENCIQTGSDWSCLLSLQLWCTTVRVTRVCDLLSVKIYIVLLDKTKTIISTKVQNASKVCLLKIIRWQKKEYCSWQKKAVEIVSCQKFTEGSRLPITQAASASENITRKNDHLAWPTIYSIATKQRTGGFQTALQNKSYGAGYLTTISQTNPPVVSEIRLRSLCIPWVSTAHNMAVRLTAWWTSSLGSWAQCSAGNSLLYKH